MRPAPLRGKGCKWGRKEWGRWNVQEADAKADDEDDFVALEVAHEQTGADTEDGERDALAGREVRDVDQRPGRAMSTLLVSERTPSTHQSFVTRMKE